MADHARRVNDIVVQQRDLLTGVLQANLAVVTVEQNEVVRKVSGWAAIITVPTLDRVDLRHELRAHAGARLEARLSDGARGDGHGRVRRSGATFKRIGWL